MTQLNEGLDYERLRESGSYFTETICGVEPFDYQETFLNTDSRNYVLASGRQVGKSRMCAWKALHQAVTKRNQMVLIIAPSLRQSSLLFDAVKTEIANSALSEDDWGIVRQTQTILELENGSKVHCLPTGRTGDKIRGYSADMVIIDEAAFIDDSIFEDIVEPMLYATSGKMILASTPYGTSSYFYRKFDKAKYDGNDWQSTQVPSWESPLINEEDVEKMKDGKTQPQIDREIRGEFTEDSAQFFPGEKIAVLKGQASNSYEGQLYLGADIAAAGSDETVFYGVDETGNIFLNETHQKMGVLEAGDRIETLDSSYDFDEVVIDRTGLGQGTVESLPDDGRLARKIREEYFTIQTKTRLYQGLRRALEAEELSLPDDSSLTGQLDDITFEKKSKGNLSFETRQREHDDHVDALALAVSGLPSQSVRQRGAGGASTPVFSEQTNQSGYNGPATNRGRSRRNNRSGNGRSRL